MAEFLFIQPSELTETTILGGNVDPDKYMFCVAYVQLNVIEPLLGTELYDKILSEAEADTLAGDYLTLYNEYVKPITKHQALAEYLEIASYDVSNGGVFKHQPESSEIVDTKEVYALSNKWHSMAQLFIGRFYKWICKNPLTEYKLSQDDVNASKNIKATGGWYLNSGRAISEDDLFIDKYRYNK